MSTQSKRENRRSIAVRAALSGLLASSLSSKELKDFAEQDIDFEFVSALRHALISLELSVEIEPIGPYEVAFPGQLVEIILDEVKRRRLTKSQVHKYMKEIDPDLASMIIHPEHTLRQSVDFFVTHTTSETGNELLGYILGGVPQDPFLTGIAKRK